jgi:hypothetical protein
VLKQLFWRQIARLAAAELAAHRPQRALQEFDKAAASLPPGRAGEAGNASSPVWRNGARAMPLSALGQQR